MSFVAPLFLLAVLAGLVPVALHLIHRQKAPELPFGTLRFLRRSVQRTRRRKYLDDVVLLAVRAAALVLLAVGLAGPVVTALGALWGRGGAAVVLILDNSGSMALTDAGEVRLETARRAGEEVLDSLREGDAVALLPTSGPAAPEHGRLTHSQETIRQALGQCRLSAEHADLATRLNQARELLAAAESSAKAIYVLTDNQVVSWDGLREGNEEEPQKSAAPVVVVNVARDPAPNVAVRGVHLEGPAPAPGVPVAVRVEVFNATALPQQRHVELHLDGRPEATSPTLTVPPQASVWHEFHVTAEQPGAHRGEVRLAEQDGCAADNHRHFVLNLDAQVAVAVLIPRRGDIAYIDDAFYLERVLAPTGGGWSIHPTVLTPAELTGETLSAYRVVFCVNLPPPDPAAAERLRDYVEGGGRLVWVCGDNTDAAAFNRLHEQLGGRLLPAPLSPHRDAAGPKKESWSIAFLDRDHPALAPLVEPASLYQSVLVHKHFPIQVGPESGVRVLARLSDGEPLLVERSVGAGLVLLLGTAAHVAWTNLPLKPLFLPLVTRLTFHLAGVETDRAQVPAGTPLSVALPGGSAADVEVVRPSGEMLRLHSGEGSRTFRYADTHEPGIYLVRRTDPQRPRLWAFAVNGDPAESDPAILSREELARRFGGEPFVYCEGVQELPAVLRRLREGRSLWELFLGAVLAGLVAEAYLANCRGRKPVVAGTASREESSSKGKEPASMR